MAEPRRDTDTGKPAEWPSSMSSEGRPHGDERERPIKPREPEEPILLEENLDERGIPS